MFPEPWKSSNYLTCLWSAFELWRYLFPISHHTSEIVPIIFEVQNVLHSGHSFRENCFHFFVKRAYNRNVREWLFFKVADSLNFKCGRFFYNNDWVLGNPVSFFNTLLHKRWGSFPTKWNGVQFISCHTDGSWKMCHKPMQRASKGVLCCNKLRK